MLLLTSTMTAHCSDLKLFSDIAAPRDWNTLNVQVDDFCNNMRLRISDYEATVRVFDPHVTNGILPVSDSSPSLSPSFRIRYEKISLESLKDTLNQLQKAARAPSVGLLSRLSSYVSASGVDFTDAVHTIQTLLHSLASPLSKYKGTVTVRAQERTPERTQEQEIYVAAPSPYFGTPLLEVQKGAVTGSRIDIRINFLPTVNAASACTPTSNLVREEVAALPSTYIALNAIDKTMKEKLAEMQPRVNILSILPGKTAPSIFGEYSGGTDTHISYGPLQSSLHDLIERYQAMLKEAARVNDSSRG